MIGFPVEENMHLVQELVDQKIMERPDFLESVPEEIRAIVEVEWRLSLGSSYLKGLITEKLRLCEQHSHIFQQNTAGNVLNDLDPRVFPG